MMTETMQKALAWEERRREATRQIDDVLSGRAQWCVIQGNCLEVLPTMVDASIGVTICDPPFNQRTSQGARRSRNADWIGDPRARFISFDGLADAAWVVQALRSTKRWVLAFCALEQIGAYETAAGASRWIRGGVWVKPDSAPQYTGDRPAQGAEGVAIMHREGRKRWNGGGHRAVWTYCVEKTAQYIGHPTPKPVPLMLELVDQFTDPGEVILDPFCGSGTTGVACLRLGRRFIGIERDEKYAAIARERLTAETQGMSLRSYRAGQMALFGGAHDQG